jgi:hypothetical protein
MRSRSAVVDELVADGLPGFAGIIGTLDELTEPPGGLRCVETVGVSGRSFEVVDFPAGNMRTADVPSLALAVCRQHERPLARADEYSNAAHSSLLFRSRDRAEGRTLIYRRPTAKFIFTPKPSAFNFVSRLGEMGRGTSSGELSQEVRRIAKLLAIGGRRSI